MKGCYFDRPMHEGVAPSSDCVPESSRADCVPPSRCAKTSPAKCPFQLLATEAFEQRRPVRWQGPAREHLPTLGACGWPSVFVPPLRLEFHLLNIPSQRTRREMGIDQAHR